MPGRVARKSARGKWLPSRQRHANHCRNMAELVPPLTRTASIAGLCWLGFAAIAIPVTQGWTQSFDEAAMIAMRSGPSALNGLFTAITRLGEGPLRFALAVVAAIALLLLRHQREALFVAFAVLPAGLINGEMKQLFARPRPSVVDHLVGADGFSFPSGHAFGSTALYLALALAFLPLVRAEFHRPAICAALLIGGLIAFSRVWLGVHYPSDALAGWLGAVGWVLGCWVLVARVAAPRT